MEQMISAGLEELGLTGRVPADALPPESGFLVDLFRPGIKGEDLQLQAVGPAEVQQARLIPCTFWTAPPSSSSATLRVRPSLT